MKSMQFLMGRAMNLSFGIFKVVDRSGQVAQLYWKTEQCLIQGAELLEMMDVFDLDIIITHQVDISFSRFSFT